MKSSIPDLVGLKKLCSVEPESQNHSWGKVQILYETHRLAKTHGWGDVRHHITVIHICKDCATLRRTTYFYNGVWTSYSTLQYVKPKDYKESKCYNRHPSVKLGRSAYFCKVCGKKYHKRSQKADCERKHDESKKWQINKNFEILWSLSPYENLLGLKQVRYYFAVYRLYKYCGLSPRDIERKAWKNYGFWLEEKKIKQIVVEVFTFLCSEDKECVLKPFLKK